MTYFLSNNFNCSELFLYDKKEKELCLDNIIVKTQQINTSWSLYLRSPLTSRVYYVAVILQGLSFTLMISKFYFRNVFISYSCFFQNISIIVYSGLFLQIQYFAILFWKMVHKYYMFI
jgi:hypothetical protein